MDCPAMTPEDRAIFDQLMLAIWMGVTLEDEALEQWDILVCAATMDGLVDNPYRLMAVARGDQTTVFTFTPHGKEGDHEAGRSHTAAEHG